MPRYFLGTEVDRCSREILSVPSTNGNVDIRKGERREVSVSSNRFKWYCGDSKEWTTAPNTTNLVQVERESEGRKITWYCFRDELAPGPATEVDLSDEPFPEARSYSISNSSFPNAKIKVRTFDRNYFFYAEAGCTAKVENGPYASQITIVNAYFTEYSGLVYQIARQSRAWHNVKEATLKYYAGGFNVKIKLWPDFSLSTPSGGVISGLLPISGITSDVTVILPHVYLTSVTAIGRYKNT